MAFTVENGQRCGTIQNGQRDCEDGGGSIAAGFVTVADISFIDAHAALGDTDLNVVGSSFTFDGLLWQTPTVANSGIDMVTSASSFGLVATGLRATGVTGGVYGVPPSVASIFASLEDIAAAYNFDPDPTRQYIFEAYITELANTTANTDEIGLMVNKLAGAPPGSSDSRAYCNLGRVSGVDDTPSYQAGVGAGPPRQQRTDLAGMGWDVLALHYNGTGHSIDAYVGQYGATWPTNGSLERISTWANNTALSQSLPGNPPDFRIGVGFDGDGGAGMDGTVAAFRVQQL